LNKEVARTIWHSM